MLEENCTITVTDYALYPPPIVEIVENVKRPLVFNWRTLVDSFRHFDIASVKKDFIFHPSSKIQKDTPKGSMSYTQRSFAIFSIIEAVQEESRK